ncbi:MAG: hypothetical protein IID37_07770 [Planctomycetes bacterium]|nr:hypothetical protein [Planctomycetota bacterium]
MASPRICATTSTSLTLLCLITGPVAADVIYVQADADGTRNGGSWSDAFDDLRAALTAAHFGDEIWVAAGTYTPTDPNGDRTSTFNLKDGVGVYGGFEGTESLREQRDWVSNTTILSGDLNGDDQPSFFNNQENSYHVLDGGGATSEGVLDGFTVTGGNAHGDCCFYNSGGGMHNSSSDQPTIANCIFTQNYAADRGGAMYNNYGTPTIINTVFVGNFATERGGGMCNNFAGPVLIDCRFSANLTDGNGGGMSNVFSNPQLTGCVFEDNQAGYRGGGLANDNLSDPILIDSVFYNNVAVSDGGAVSNWNYCHPVFLQCILADNSADYGGALYAKESCIVELTSTRISGNSATLGGGLFGEIDSELTLTNCTVIGNTATSGGAVYAKTDSVVSIGNSIFTENTLLTNHSIYVSLSGILTVVNSNIAAGSDSIQDYSDTYDWGADNIEADPQFAIAGTWAVGINPDDPFDNIWVDGDYTLLPRSPCVDAGDNALLPADSDDLDGDGDTTEYSPLDLEGGQRIADGHLDGNAVVDMGALEYQPTCAGDVNEDGMVNPLDSGFAMARFGCSVGTGDPDCDGSDVNTDGLVDPLDLGYILSRFGACD